MSSPVLARFTHLAGQVPLCTLFITALCVGIHIYTTIFQTNIGGYTLLASHVIYLGEYYRVISAALLHGGVMHIVFNMMSFLSIGSGLEMTVGTLALTFLILWTMILAGAIYVVAEWAMTLWFTGDPRYIYQPAIGFSGVIFTLALMESHRSTAPTRSIYGVIQVPTKLYPWVLLVVLSVLIPGISFLGHLSGLLVGVLHVYGYTKPLLPSPAYLVEMESFGIVRDHIGRRSNFVVCPPPQAGVQSNDSPSLRRSIQGLYSSIVALLRNRSGARGGGSGGNDGDAEASRVAGHV